MADLARRVARLERADEANDMRRLRSTERPLGLPETPLETWGRDDLALMLRNVAAAKAAGARRPLGWMSTPDLLALHDWVAAHPG